MRYAAGEVIDGQYEVQAFLAEGGAAEVYRAVDRTNGQTVVVKLPHLSTAGDLAAFNRYKREIEIGVHLDHPGIQRLLSDDRKPYMVMQYVEGDSLRKYLRAHAPLPVPQVLGIGIQLAQALELSTARASSIAT